jgi:hypothetical protein
VARPHESTTNALVEEVLRSSPHVRRWDGHEVAPAIASGVKALRHPTLGVFRLRHAVLHVGGQPDQHFVAFAHDTPEGTSRFEALAALAPPSDLAS